MQPKAVVAQQPSRLFEEQVAVSMADDVAPHGPNVTRFPSRRSARLGGLFRRQLARGKANCDLAGLFKWRCWMFHDLAPHPTERG